MSRLNPDTPNDQFDREWVENAKASMGFILRLSPVLMISYWPFDIGYLPNNYYLALFIRLLSLPVSFVGIKMLRTVKAKSQVLLLYAAMVVCYAMMINVLILLAGDLDGLYFLGLVVVAVAAYSFISLPKYLLVGLGFLIFTPFVVYECLHAMASVKPLTFSVYMMDGVCCLVVLYFANENFFRFQRKEFDSRMALNQLVKQRDEEIVTLISEVSALKIRQADYATREEAFKTARQLAHDIRAPVSALSVVAKKIRESSSDLGEFIDASSKRINDIADSILERSRQDLADQNKSYASDLAKVVQSIVEEKKVALLGCPEKKIDFELDLPLAQTQLPLRARVFEIDFIRALSNILENSIDAILSRGYVRLRLALVDGRVQIMIRDNGKGIPPEVLANVGRYGFTYGKSNGSGLGLTFAFNVVKTAGGEIKIDSAPEKGTVIELNLPLLV